MRKSLYLTVAVLLALSLVSLVNAGNERFYGQWTIEGWAGDLYLAPLDFEVGGETPDEHYGSPQKASLVYGQWWDYAFGNAGAPPEDMLYLQLPGNETRLGQEIPLGDGIDLSWWLDIGYDTMNFTMGIYTGDLLGEFTLLGYGEAQARFNPNFTSAEIIGYFEDWVTRTHYDLNGTLTKK